MHALHALYSCMSKKPKAVREPVQVYLTRDDKALLDRLSEETGLPRAEILRQGLREFSLLHGGTSPMLSFLRAQREADWSEAGPAAEHDEVLAGEYRKAE